jgi:hypothetical protein
MTDRSYLLQKSAGKLPCMSSEDFFKSTGQKMIHLTECAIQYNSQIGTYGACSKWDVIGILI